MRAVPATPANIGVLCQYMHDKTGANFDPKMCQGFAVLSDTGEFAAGVIVSNFRVHDCEISCASETPAAWRPEVCAAVFGYIFKQLGCVRCTSITKKSNTKSREFLEAFKFQLEGNVRKGYDGQKDALIYGLLAEDCQYLGALNG